MSDDFTPHNDNEAPDAEPAHRGDSGHHIGWKRPAIVISSLALVALASTAATVTITRDGVELPTGRAGDAARVLEGSNLEVETSDDTNSGNGPEAQAPGSAVDGFDSSGMNDLPPREWDEDKDPSNDSDSGTDGDSDSGTDGDSDSGTDGDSDGSGDGGTDPGPGDGGTDPGPGDGGTDGGTDGGNGGGNGGGTDPGPGPGGNGGGNGGPVSVVVDPVVDETTTVVDDATDGATTPVTDPVVEIVDEVTDVADDVPGDVVGGTLGNLGGNSGEKKLLGTATNIDPVADISGALSALFALDLSGVLFEVPAPTSD